MPRTNRPINSLLLAISLSAGIASPLALGAEESKEDASPILAGAEEQGQDETQESRKDADYVAVRVSLPDGRSFTRLEPKRTMSARYSRSGSAPISTSRRMSDGARVSVGARSVSGGSNSSSVRSGGSSGGGGGSSSSSAGGGGGGGGSSAATISKESAQEGGLEARASSAGVFSFGNSGSGFESNSSGDNGSSSSRDSDSRPAVPTVGSPRFDREGNASGGQRVEFHDAGMSAAVIGNRVYLNDVELVSADQPFSIITGTRVGSDSVIMEDGRLSSNGVDHLSSFNTGSSSIKLEFDSDTTVTLSLYTQSSNSLNPDREMRTWTVRIR